MRKIRFALKFSFLMICIGVKRFIYPLYKNKMSQEKREAYLTKLEKSWAEGTMRASELKIEVIGK